MKPRCLIARMRIKPCRGGIYFDETDGTKERVSHVLQLLLESRELMCIFASILRKCE